jgi:mono/diheme cytochrome c family protein
MGRKKDMRKTEWLKWGTMAAIAGLAFAACDKKETPDAAKGNADAPGAAAPAREAASTGVGPIHEVSLGTLDPALVAQGEKIFSGTCSACHKLEQRYVGPALAGVTKRRSPEWIMNMILNPSGMTQQDPTARELLGEYMTQMSVNVTQADARAVLEFFRQHDGT